MSFFLDDAMTKCLQYQLQCQLENTNGIKIQNKGKLQCMCYSTKICMIGNLQAHSKSTKTCIVENNAIQNPQKYPRVHQRPSLLLVLVRPQGVPVLTPFFQFEHHLLKLTLTFRHEAFYEDPCQPLLNQSSWHFHFHTPPH